MTEKTPKSQNDRAPSSEPMTPAAKAAAAWVGQFARTLKTCRLYDAQNPTVVRFREETAAALRKALDESGPWTLRFTTDDVMLDEVSLYPARSRDDNLALPFYRDGVRALTLEPGIEPGEVQAIVDAVLQVSGQNLTENDLVTLLWEANLRHVDIDYVPAEDDVGAGGPGEMPEGEALPWPSGMAEDEGAEGAATEVSVEEAGDEVRSDDWTAGHPVSEIEATFEELTVLSSTEAARFRGLYQQQREIPLLTSALALSRAALAAGARDDDRLEIGRFQPRLLRLAVSRGAWLEAREVLGLLRECGSPDWSAETFAQELLQPISISGAIEHLDRQEASQVLEFIALSREIGDPGVDWLNLVLAESQQRRTRRLLAEAIAQTCKEQPERLAPWLADPRWYVVRNVVHILGWIGGRPVAALLQTAARHTDPRVRAEVVGALAQVELSAARPILLRMLDGADTRLFSAILHQLSGDRDRETSQRLLIMLQDAAFEQRSPEEQRSIYSALGATGADAQLADLEAELHRGSWFTRYDAHRQNVARVIARIGTPLALEILQRNAASKRSAVRKACEDALGGLNAA